MAYFRRRCPHAFLYDEEDSTAEWARPSTTPFSYRDAVITNRRYRCFITAAEAWAAADAFRIFIARDYACSVANFY